MPQYLSGRLVTIAEEQAQPPERVAATFQRLPWSQGYVLMVNTQIRMVTPFFDVVHAYLRGRGKDASEDDSIELWFGNMGQTSTYRKVDIL